ncbi:MAG: molybdopterin dinucleotide binding domain-containing protein, partial [Thermodesulfobacteriota bacterium]|nr:molybdopterin dinucleotide binding domain-containing protein [Thermodesulfobacteriota bacterium]
ARNCGVKDGGWAVIETRRGEAKMKVKVTEDAMEGVIAMPHGWSGEGNVNLLTGDSEGLDPVIGTPQLRGIACRIKKAA